MNANNEQLQAINSSSDRILCLAGAGAGKTATMVERISRLINTGIDPSSILALTFTNAAAAEMKERFERKNPGKETPEFRTFHSFCYSILCKDPNIRQALGYAEVPMIASDEQIKGLEEKAKTQCNIKLSKEKLTYRENLTKQEQYQIELYDKALDRLMRSANVITFDKLNSAVAELFASGNPATQIYKYKYKYLFSDETQDLDPYQFNFLSSFSDSKFFLVGDSQQNIYSFRGTTNEYIKVLSSSPDWEKIRLFINYRSTNQICAYANKFSKSYADASYWIEMQGTREGERVHTILVDGPSKYSAINLDDIDNVLKEMESLSGTSAILCRTNKEVDAVTFYLTNKGVDFTTGKDTKVQRLVECALSDTYMIGWLASYLPSNKYGEYIRLTTQTKNPDLTWFLKLYGNVSQIKSDVAIIKRLRDISTDFGVTNTKLIEVADLLHLHRIEPADKEYFGTAFLNYLRTAVDNIKSSELYVGTIHSVKGLEYDNVFVMNVGSYNFMLNNEDEKNLFYVAVTRAKNRLYVYELFDD